MGMDPGNNAFSATLAEQLLHFSRTTVIAKKSVGDNSTDRDRIADDFETPSPSTVPKQFPISVAPPVSCPSSEIGGTPSRNMIEGMVDSYRQMLERRRLVYCRSSIRDILSGTMPTSRPACYYGERVRRDRLRVDIALLVEFLNNTPPFPTLEVDDKIALMKNFSVSFSILEKYYITMRAGGLQTNR
ncbi:hypothetical protein ANCCAN_25553 [Ancylostoma caninum]|uniref:NR LBD domain-containing protein n=1 Tax=Ancylostoma caninum TaxID=29170 RepID=A0A368FCS2_ANCCA|nr:hypothetical protein ANCCAN_25553 [Ancylostoma caninum]